MILKTNETCYSEYCHVHKCQHELPSFLCPLHSLQCPDSVTNAFEATETFVPPFLLLTWIISPVYVIYSEVYKLVQFLSVETYHVCLHYQ